MRGLLKDLQSWKPDSGESYRLRSGCSHDTAELAALAPMAIISPGICRHIWA